MTEEFQHPDYKQYLGDGLYAEFDSYQIWLYTPQGMRVALEPSVYQALLDYRDRLHATLRKRNSH
jgi:hypothetical protein